MVKKSRRKEVEPDSLSVKEYADLKGIHPNTVYRLIGVGELEAERIGRSWRIPNPSKG
jgi:excisionase family DNA binding protein